MQQLHTHGNSFITSLQGAVQIPIATTNGMRFSETPTGGPGMVNPKKGGKDCTDLTRKWQLKDDVDDDVNSNEVGESYKCTRKTQI